jgi:small-conductance mechanosensitive channel
MTPQGVLPREVAEAIFLAIRLLAAVVLLVGLFVCVRRAILAFAGERSRRLGRRGVWRAGAMLGALVLMDLARGPVEMGLRVLGDAISALPVITDRAWPGGILIGLYQTAMATLGLVLAIQLVGAVYWFVEGRVEAWRARIGPATDARALLVKAVSVLNRVSRVGLLAGLVGGYLLLSFRLFPRTAAVLETLRGPLGTPAQKIGLAIVGYLPNLGYLAVIGLLGWLLLRLLRYIFAALASGSLVVPGFYPEWAEPTYKLVRTLVLLFLLMVSFPYLPGAGSQFFQGFSLFAGALVTLGSAGAISNIVAGIALTYTRAFRVGDMVQFGETYGVVLGKSLLVTRLRTHRNEEVTIPNGSVLSSAVVNFSARAAAGGVALTVGAGIGYDVDWRIVHRLMREAAEQTEHILPEPAPQVWQSNLGDYAVTYELRAWTGRPEAMFEIHSALRRNVLDAFNRAGVEIMTPSILAHRDASGLAIPREAFPDRPSARGIAVDVERWQEARDTGQNVEHA